MTHLPQRLTVTGHDDHPLLILSSLKDTHVKSVIPLVGELGKIMKVRIENCDSAPLVTVEKRRTT